MGPWRDVFVIVEGATLGGSDSQLFAGKIRLENPVSSTSAFVCNVLIQIPQAFHRLTNPPLSALRIDSERDCWRFLLSGRCRFVSCLNSFLYHMYHMCSRSRQEGRGSWNCFGRRLLINICRHNCNNVFCGMEFVNLERITIKHSNQHKNGHCFP